MATTEFTISVDSWTEIGTGPLLVETKQRQNAFLHFADAAPATGETAYHNLVGPAAFSYGGTAKCFARAAHGDAKIVVTEAV